MKRRGFLALGMAGALPAWLPAHARDNALGRQGMAAGVPLTGPSARAVIVGGGMAGATLAKYLRLWGGAKLKVTLIEREPRYTSCIMSSLVLSGQRSLDSLKFRYDKLRDVYGVEVVAGEVVDVDTGARKVRLADGRSFAGDRLVLAPGIDFDAVPGLDDPDAMPHAWKAGPQTTLLARQMQAMPVGGTMVLTIPPVPYRCPPGPYERACLVADWMKRNKPGSKLIVLDANADFVVERDNFQRAFFELHADVIEYRTSVVIDHVDPATRTLFTNTGNVTADVVNLIPQQRAGALIAKAGLANATGGRFAGVDVLSYESTVAAGVHVLGDSSATTQPKAGHIANQEAKVCADALVRLFAGGQPDPAPVTNSACYSTITMSKASWLTAVFQYDPATRLMTPVTAASKASLGWNADQFEQMQTWFHALMADTFA